MVEVNPPPTEAVAIVGDALLQLPPEDASFNVIVPPVHTDEGPVIDEGTELTVTTAPTDPHEVV
jgi:hypothetical protein